MVVFEDMYTDYQSLRENDNHIDWIVLTYNFPEVLFVYCQYFCNFRHFNHDNPELWQFISAHYSNQNKKKSLHY